MNNTNQEIAKLIDDWIDKLELEENSLETKIEAIGDLNPNVQATLVKDLAEIQIKLLRLADLSDKIILDTENEADTLQAYFHKLEHDEEFFSVEGRRASLFKAACQNATRKLSELHIYVDRTGDYPVLNASTVMLSELTTEERSKYYREKDKQHVQTA